MLWQGHMLPQPDNRNSSIQVRWQGSFSNQEAQHGPYRGSRGGMYGGVNVNAFPTVFLEFPPKGAVQMDSRYPFVTTGLESIQGTV